MFRSVLAGSAWIAARIALESATVLVHCRPLVEKDWLAFGHPFADCLGLPTVSGTDSIPVELSRQSSTGSIHSSLMCQSSGSIASQSPSSHTQNSYSPIFLQWVDCVSQLLRMYPFAFEFSSVFLVELLDSILSCRFGNFFCNSYKESQRAGVYDACGCTWLICGFRREVSYAL